MCVIKGKFVAQGMSVVVLLNLKADQNCERLLHLIPCQRALEELSFINDDF